MANTYTSLSLSYDTARRFVEDFSAEDHDQTKYVFIGNSNQYANSDTTIPDVVDAIATEKTIWDSMFAAKRITGNDVSLVIPRKNWTANTKYRQYDDIVDSTTLLSANTTLNLEPMYVITSDFNVYKCLSNNASNTQGSIVEPTGDFTTSNGFITTTENGQNGYTWKYLFNVKQSNKFLTDDWIPVPYLSDALDYGLNASNFVEGAIASIIVTNSGSGYIDSNVAVTSYLSGTNIISVANTANISNNMFVTGNGIITGTYITNLDTIFKKITLSTPTISAGSGEISLKTRVDIQGDGNDDTTTEIKITNTTITKIDVTSIGTGYSTANAIIYGTGTNATARVILSPKYGHGYNPARELGANNVMIVAKFGEIDASENGIISIDTSFRQHGILSNAHRYGENARLSTTNANTVISQTLDLTLLPGTNYDLNEFVYQGTSNTDSTFSGVIHAQNSDTNTVRLINTKGTIAIGSLLKGNITSRIVSGVDYPFFEPYSGEILFVKNASKVDRYDGQSENIKIVINF